MDRECDNFIGECRESLGSDPDRVGQFSRSLVGQFSHATTHHSRLTANGWANSISERTTFVVRSSTNSNQYDLLGRNKLITWPGGNTSQTTYSRSTVVTMSAEVNRKIKQETDGLGRSWSQQNSGTRYDLSNVTFVEVSSLMSV
jgi:hypothetical protein